MEFLQQMIEFVLHIDRHLSVLCTMYGMWIYAILFLILFCETGLVVTPFLPGDSLLFVIGSLAAIEALQVEYAIPLLMAAVFTGDNTNYWIGRKVVQKFSARKNRGSSTKNILTARIVFMTGMERVRSFWRDSFPSFVRLLLSLQGSDV